MPPKFEKLKKKKKKVTTVGGKEKRDPLRPGGGRKVFTEETEGVVQVGRRLRAKPEGPVQGGGVREIRLMT